MRSAEQEEDLGELWERMQANLTAVSSSRARDRRAPAAPLRPRPAPAPLGLGAGAAPCCREGKGREGKQHMAWPLWRPRQRRATGRSHSLPLSPRGEPCHLHGGSEQGSPYGCCGRELATFPGTDLPRPRAPRSPPAHVPPHAALRHTRQELGPSPALALPRPSAAGSAAKRSQGARLWAGAAEAGGAAVWG